MLIDPAPVGRLVVRDRPLHRRMGGIGNNTWGEVNAEVEVDDNFGVGFGAGIVEPVSMTVIPVVVMVGFDGAGSSFFVGTIYVKVKRWGS